MSKLVVCDNIDNELNKSLDVSIRKLMRCKQMKRDETSVFHHLMEETRKQWGSLQTEQRDQNYLTTLLKLLSEYEMEYEQTKYQNEQMIKMLQVWLKHEHNIMAEMHNKIEKVLLIIENFYNSIHASTEGSQTPESQLMSILNQLEEIYHKNISQQKKARLELFVKKLVQEEDLF